MSNQSPLVQVIETRVPAVAAGSDAETVVGEASFAGNVTAVVYLPDTVLTGVNTNTRSVTLFNRAGDGLGVLQPATLQFNAGTNAPAMDDTAITLGNAANVAVAAGDHFSWKSLHVGTGLADPGGLIHVEITRS